MSEEPNVWVGLKACGCCVAVVVDVPGHEKHTAKTKREFLRDGLSVVRGTWQDWEGKYLPSMKAECGHVVDAVCSRVVEQ